MTILLSDPRVAMVPVHDNGDPLVPLDPAIGRRTFVRAGLADRLLRAQVAPHVAGAAVDLTLVDACGDELDMGTPIDAMPEESDGRCWFAADGISADARAHRNLLASVVGSVGLVNYPTEWWHWSYGDRYWALVTGHPHALYGSVATEAAA